MIRKLTRGDADAYRGLRLLALRTNPEVYFATIEEESRRDSYSFAAEISGYKEPFGYIGWFDDQERLLAYVQLTPAGYKKTSHVAELFNLYVHPEVRGKGIARKLLTSILQSVQELPEIEIVFLTVISGNIPAKKLYESLGFVAYAVKDRSVKGPNGYLSEILMRYDIQR